MTKKIRYKMKLKPNNDVIGNAGKLISCDELSEVDAIILSSIDNDKIIHCYDDNQYYGSKDTVTWWDAYFTNEYLVNELIYDIKEDVPASVNVDEILSDYGYDYEDHASSLLEGCAFITEEYNLDIDTDIKLRCYYI